MKFIKFYGSRNLFSEGILLRDLITTKHDVKLTMNKTVMSV